MKTNLFLFVLLTAIPLRAATTIDPVNRYAYGANIGWINCAGDTANGAVIGEYVCSGYIYSANIGWINLGSGVSANGIAYQNNSAVDFGVNNDGLGNLRGYAYAANAGWIAFENTGAPAVDLRTGVLSGSVWSANCGWISLSNAVAYVQTDTISPGALDTNGLPIAWELTYFGQTGINPNADPDGDGMSNYQEYLAGTNPTNADSNLIITAQAFTSNGVNSSVTWTSVPSRLYYLEQTPDLASTNWQDSGLGLISPSASSDTTADFTAPAAPARFYRVQAVIPLAP
ncbi:MAG TPA: thrombospondin type 3 repeat-containing protein [Verrucomicrobiae bacterium]|jgi:hypothetical protein|nr:thrombospondin type 3 repeat-containing protein [Verrucomicrobiae bacterium]